MGIVDVWSDKQIAAGENWQEKITDALTQTQVAILLISADFLASDFIVNNELPPLLSKAKNDGTTIIPVILKPSRFARDSNLKKFQAINSPDEPLISSSEYNNELVYDAVVYRIEGLIEIEPE